MNCRVIVEAAVPVYDVETPDEAIRIAISKTGEMLNPDLNYVEIDMSDRTSPSGEELPPAFIAADEALVALELEMTVFNVEREEHASRIARKEIGQRLENIPLEVVEIETVEPVFACGCGYRRCIRQQAYLDDPLCPRCRERMEMEQGHEFEIVEPQA
jgi:uncharacterized protein (UPF0212 family)